MEDDKAPAFASRSATAKRAKVCPLCQGRFIRSFLRLEGQAMVSDGRTVAGSLSKAECLSCGVVFSRDEDHIDLHRLYAEEYELELYEEAKFEGAESRSRHVSRKVRALVKLSGTSPTRIGEVGAGSGRLLVELSRTMRDCAFWGVDMAPSSRAAGRRAGLPIEVGGPEALPRSLDVVLAIAVLEHSLDPADFVRQCVDVMSPKGVLVLGVPGRLEFSHDFFVLDHIVHLHYEHIARLAETAGLSIWHYEKAQSTSDLDYYLLGVRPTIHTSKPRPSKPRHVSSLLSENHRERRAALLSLERVDDFIAIGDHGLGVYGIGERFDFLRTYSAAFRGSLASAALVDDFPARASRREHIGPIHTLASLPAQSIRSHRWIVTFPTGRRRLAPTVEVLYPFEKPPREISVLEQ